MFTPWENEASPHPGLDRRNTYFWGAKVPCSPGSPVRHEWAGPEGLCSPCVSQPDGHHHHSAERRTPALSSGTSRGQCRLSVVTDLLSSHTFTPDSVAQNTLTHAHAHAPRSWPAPLVTGWRLTPARAMLIKVHPQHDSPSGEVTGGDTLLHSDILLTLYLHPPFGSLNINISR